MKERGAARTREGMHPNAEDYVRRNRLPKRKPMIVFFLVWLGASVTPLSAQSTSADQVWDQLQSRAYTTAESEGFALVNYMVGWLMKGASEDSDSNWPRTLDAGYSYLIVGVCDNDCPDVDLSLEDEAGVAVASDTGSGDMPLIRFAPSKTALYWIDPTMHACSREPCAYGIAIFRK